MVEKNDTARVPSNCKLQLLPGPFKAPRVLVNIEARKGVTIWGGAIDLGIRRRWGCFFPTRQEGIHVASRQSLWMPLATPLLSCDGKRSSTTVLAREGHGDQELRPLSIEGLCSATRWVTETSTGVSWGWGLWRVEEGEDEHQCVSETSCRGGWWGGLYSIPLIFISEFPWGRPLGILEERLLEQNWSGKEQRHVWYVVNTDIYCLGTPFQRTCFPSSSECW